MSSLRCFTFFFAQVMTSCAERVRSGPNIYFEVQSPSSSADDGVDLEAEAARHGSSRRARAFLSGDPLPGDVVDAGRRTDSPRTATGRLPLGTWRLCALRVLPPDVLEGGLYASTRPPPRRESLAHLVCPCRCRHRPSGEEAGISIGFPSSPADRGYCTAQNIRPLTRGHFGRVR